MGDRMFLRKLELKDAPLMLAWMHDKRVTAFIKTDEYKKGSYDI